MQPPERRRIPLSTALLLVLVFVLLSGGFAYAYYVKQMEFTTQNAAAMLERDLLRERLAATEDENNGLRSLLQQAADENVAFGRQVEELASTVGYLNKLNETDRELLQKYSSVFFLNDNFVPDPLVPIDDELVLRTDGNVMMHGQVFPFLKRMMEAAANDGEPLKVLSAYRSFGTQSALKESYKVTYGSGANKFSADQGYSEHQLGSTLDFTTDEDGATLAAFKGTSQFNWLVRHAHEYGFVLSYPDGNQYFQYEPWHWRFVGVDLATRLYHENKYFYDLDQREINPYLGRIFD